MSATTIMRELLLARSSVTSVVPAARIYVGALPQGFSPPCILVSDIGGNEIPTVARRRAFSTIRARVQVTVYAKTYAVQEALLLACKLGPGVHTGVVREYHVNAVEQLGTNPAMPPGDDGIFERSRDFMITFKEAN